MRLLTLDPPIIKYSVIYADPPWPYKLWSGDAVPSRTADSHYDTMTIADIMALPVASMAADDCVLLLWVTMPLLVEGIATGIAWGFEYKTCSFAWVKMTKKRLPFIGLGYWTRANVELCLLFTKGSPKRRAKDVPQVILSQRGAHSAKPVVAYDHIERLLDGPYLELFARRHKPGWDVWGNEAPESEEQWQQPLFAE